MSKIEIAGRIVGAGAPVFVIAEAGVNHNGNVEMAKRLVDVAAEAGADAVKFQTFVAERMLSEFAPKAEYQLQATDARESQLEMIRRLELTPASHYELRDYCRERGVIFMSTPFDEESAQLLVELNVPAIKIASGEVTNLPFLETLARTGKPLILSTGMSTLGEVDEAVCVLREAGCTSLVLLHCLTNYPADPAGANLRAMQTMAAAFRVPVGYSDHTTGIEVALAAVALGACVIEKHFTLDKNLPGPDHLASLEPHELTALIQGIRKVESALGDGQKRPAEIELRNALVARRSLVAAADIPAGTRLTRELIAIKRPGTGLQPNMLAQLVGRIVRVDVRAGCLLEWEMLD